MAYEEGLTLASICLGCVAAVAALDLLLRWLGRPTSTTSTSASSSSSSSSSCGASFPPTPLLGLAVNAACCVVALPDVLVTGSYPTESMFSHNFWHVPLVLHMAWHLWRCLGEVLGCRPDRPIGLLPTANAVFLCAVQLHWPFGPAGVALVCLGHALPRALEDAGRAWAGAGAGAGAGCGCGCWTGRRAADDDASKHARWASALGGQLELDADDTSETTGLISGGGPGRRAARFNPDEEREREQGGGGYHTSPNSVAAKGWNATNTNANTNTNTNTNTRPCADRTAALSTTWANRWVRCPGSMFVLSVMFVCLQVERTKEPIPPLVIAIVFVGSIMAGRCSSSAVDWGWAHSSSMVARRPP